MKDCPVTCLESPGLFCLNISPAECNQKTHSPSTVINMAEAKEMSAEKRFLSVKWKKENKILDWTITQVLIPKS